MWPTPDAFPRSTLCFTEMLGGLFLASADAAQRMQFLVGRLAVGTADNCLRTHILRGDDIVFAADRAELEHRISLLMEASAEGCVTIIRHYIEEVTAAHIRCLQGVFETGAPTAPLLQLTRATPSTKPAGLRPARHATLNARG